MLWFLAGGGPIYVPSDTPSPQPSGIFIAAPGLNIGAFLGILIPLVAVAIAVLTWRDARTARAQRRTAETQQALAREAKEAVEQLALVLSERLETKENVAIIRIDVGRLKTRIDALQQVLEILDHKIDGVKSDVGRRRGGT